MKTRSAVSNPRMVAGAIVALAVLSCTHETAVIARLTEVTDSAGVTVVSLLGDLAGYAVPNLKVERSYRVGTDGSGIELYRVAGARFTETKQLVIANSGSQEIVVVDETGRLSHRFGDKGEGPGQFITITSVHVTADGTIVAYDDSQGRLSEFDSVGRLLSTRRMTDPSPVSDLIPLLASMSGTALAVYGDNRRFGQAGTVRRDSTPLFRFEPTSLEPDTVSLWPGRSWSFGKTGMGATRAQPAFGPDLVSAGSTDHGALADTHRSEVTVFDSDGAPTMIVRWDEPDEPVSDSDLATWRRERTEQLSDELPKELRAQLLDVPPFQWKPHVRGIALGRDGVLWIAPALLRSGKHQRWILIDRDGKTKGGVLLPMDSQVLDATSSYLAVLDKSALDVELITVYSLED